MRGEVKNLFERYCDSKNASPKTAEELKPLLRDFLEVLNQDLVRAFFLKSFSRIQADIPNLIEPFHTLLKELPTLEDPLFKGIQEQKENLPVQRIAMLQGYLAPYQLCRDEWLLAFQGNPSQEQLTQLTREFDPKPWIEKLNTFKSGTKKVYDSLYHQKAGKFLSDFEKLREQRQKDSLKKVEFQAIRNHLLSSLYNLIYRGEIGIELTELALTGRLSFLCYAEMMAKPEEDFTQMLPGRLVTSQWDWLHDNKLLQKDLFLALRKKGASEITKELNGRLEMIKLLGKLSKNKWIDPKQMETILKNSFTQLVPNPLESLQIFTIKKEIGPFVQGKAKGAVDEKKIMDNLSTLMKSNEALKSFYQELLGNADSLEARANELPLETIRELLETAKESPQQAGPFQKMREKMLPIPGGKPAEDPASKSDSILQEIAKLQQQLLQSVSVMDELMATHCPQGTAIAFLEKHQIFLPETEQFFRRQLQILQQQVKDRKNHNKTIQMLGKLKDDMRNNLTLDTQFFILRETLKKYEGHWELTQEELAIIKNMDFSTQERELFLELCLQKYKFLSECKSVNPDPERLASLQMELASPLLIHLLQDILKEQPFYFSQDELESFKTVLPKIQNEQIALSRKNSLLLYENGVGNLLFSKLVQWGIWQMKGTEQAELIQTITNSFNAEVNAASPWHNFKSLAVSKKSLEKIVSSIPPKLEEIIDHKGKNVLNNMKTMLVKNDESGIKNIDKRAIEYLVKSLTATDYITKIHDLFESFAKIENSAQSGKTGESPETDAPKVTKQFQDILNMEFHDQRLELLLDELIAILPPGTPVIETGKKLYQDLTGFQY